MFGNKNENSIEVVCLQNFKVCKKGMYQCVHAINDAYLDYYIWFLYNKEVLIRFLIGKIYHKYLTDIYDIFEAMLALW